MTLWSIGIVHPTQSPIPWKQECGQLKMTELAVKCLSTLMHRKTTLFGRSDEEKDGTKCGYAHFFFSLFPNGRLKFKNYALEKMNVKFMSVFLTL